MWLQLAGAPQRHLWWMSEDNRLTTATLMLELHVVGVFMIVTIDHLLPLASMGVHRFFQ